MMYIMTSEGVVTKMGGMLSHAAVVCRELGKACVVGVNIEKILDGCEIRVDGTVAEVHLI
jgi:pyruvate,water dikinase